MKFWKMFKIISYNEQNYVCNGYRKTCYYDYFAGIKNATWLKKCPHTFSKTRDIKIVLRQWTDVKNYLWLQQQQSIEIRGCVHLFAEIKLVNHFTRPYKLIQAFFLSATTNNA